MPASGAAKVPAFDFAFHPSASPFAITQQAYLAARPDAEYDSLATGTLVFDDMYSATPRILLIQRAAGDSMPNLWETPGGGCDDEDESILYAAARELWEEAGLKAMYITAPVGDPHYFCSRSGKRICKFNFVISVESNARGELAPTLNPVEHQKFVWASEDEVRARKVKDTELPFTMKEVEDTILHTFSLLKEGSGTRRQPIMQTQD